MKAVAAGALLLAALARAGCAAPRPPDPDLAWVLLPGGTFIMGSDDGYDDEKPAHPETVAPFRITRAEITVEQYAACVKAGSCTPPGRDGYCNWSEPGRRRHPVNCVDFAQAEAFARWAGGRLPTEAEWEYAARGAGQNRDYPWGAEPPTCKLAVLYSADKDFGCGHDSTFPVCSKPRGSTRQGLCDMVGNVWEWVAAEYRSYGSPSGSTGSDRKVVRGGSWHSFASAAGARVRGSNPPDYRGGDVGFRIAAYPPAR